MKTALTVVFAVICVFIIVLVLCQEAKDNGLGSLAGGSAAGETYWGKNKGRSMDKERVLVLLTTVAVILFLALALLLSSKVLN
ncbi:MAG: preprotein translocase subunit SecG [Bacteroidales bacterium]|nr:preprotein translocase subunit SecG [Clostridium sp.]MCM1204822.1 preprotein translocase subunit SecG [Bacteroidales bacterium]